MKRRKGFMKKMQHLAMAGALGITGVMSGGISTCAADESYDWLIYVYMCGSDLESDGAMGTMDLEEMLDGDLGENSAFIVQTGGAVEWQNELVTADSGSRLLIVDGECYELDTTDSENMGDANTLAEFLRWGPENGYEAEHTGLVLWNHGSGSINGVCFDEQYDYDSLSLAEMDQALAGADRFDFIGFDACLMGSYETANMLKDHADYMIGSEETEPGLGWDYSAIGSAMADNPDPEELGQVICDSFYQSCEDYGDDEIATLSVIDLSGMDALTAAFNKAAGKMNDSLCNISELGTIAGAISKVENYGGNNDAEGYTNMVDMGHLLLNLSDDIPEAADAYKALQNIVVYQVTGDQRANSNGLSIYYPLSVQGSEELSIFAANNPSSNYVRFAQGMVCGAITGSVSDYLDETADYYDDEDYSDDEYDDYDDEDYDDEDYDDEDYDEYDDEGGLFDFIDSLLEDWESGDTTHESSIEFEEDVHLDDDGYYTFTIAEDSMDYVQAVHIDVYQCPEGEDGIYYLGNDNNVIWEDNVITDNFEGVWPSLPDGQELMYYILEETDEYTLFTTPVILNGEEMNLRFMWVWSDPEEDEGDYYVLGAWKGNDEEHGCSSKGYQELKDGDVIAPVYYGYSDVDEEEMEEYVGEDFEIDGELTLDDQVLREGTYEYAFEVVDVFGQSVYTDYVEFYVDEDGEVNLLEE